MQRIGSEEHNPVLPRRRRKVVQKRLPHSRDQLVLEFDNHNHNHNHNHQAPAEQRAEGLIEALADLLLEALRAEELTMKGGEDEHQNHV
jgi:hypothetical protein